MIRTRAALIHLLVSATIVGLVLAVVFFAWYPGFLFALAGAISPVLVMMSVDVTLGPLLTFIVFKPGKPGLKFDMAFIFTVQIIALGYGTLTLYNERPHFLVFAVDGFAAVAERHVDMSMLRYEELADKPLIGPVNVYARMPTDPSERSAFLEGVLFEGKPDLERRTEFYEPYENGAETIRARATAFDDFSPANAAEEAEVARVRQRYSGQPFLVLPARGPAADEDFSVLLDSGTLEPVDAMRASSWRAEGS